MVFRKARLQDLQEIKTVFKAIVRSMNDRGITIWNETYPCEVFEQDILNGYLYVLTEEGGRILSAVALLPQCQGNAAVIWQYPAKKPVFMFRLGVDPQYAGQGLGQMTVHKAMETAAKLGADSLRLFVVDINEPAIALYEKMGFLKAQGVYIQSFDAGYTLSEYAYEWVLE